MSRRLWSLTLLAACGTDRAVPVDATLDLDDAFGTGIDAAVDAPPVSNFPVTCTGMLTAEMHQGADPFAGRLTVGTQVSVVYSYDPDLTDEQPADPMLFDHQMIGAPQAALTITVGADPDRWVFATDPTTNCRLTIANAIPPPETGNDSLTFGCVSMTATPAIGAETAHTGELVLSSTNANFLTSDAPPDGAPPGVGTAGVMRTFTFTGDRWEWSGTLNDCAKR